MSAQQVECSSTAGRRMDGSRQKELCQQIRRLIQEHSLELANGRDVNRSILDEALRSVWVLEQATTQS